MIKDFMKYRQFLRTQNLSVNEQYMLELLFELHNEQYGYAFPSFEFLLDAFNTTSKNRVSKVLTDLETKGFIKKEKVKRSNRYTVLNIKDFIVTKIIETKEEPTKEIVDEIMQEKIEIVEKTTKKKSTSKMKAKLETVEVEDLKNVDEDLQELEKVNETYYINAIDIYLNNKNKSSNVRSFKPSYKSCMAEKSGVGMSIDGKDFLDYEDDEFNTLVEKRQKIKCN